MKLDGILLLVFVLPVIVAAVALLLFGGTVWLLCLFLIDQWQRWFVDKRDAQA